MNEKKWYRVIDPLSPLYGCDVSVKGGIVTYLPDTMTPDRRFTTVTGLRRVDVFVGDRPFQLIAKDGEDLGLLIDRTQLEDSPIQDEIVVTGTDRPFGLCLDESEMTREDGTCLRIARYEQAIQIAVTDSDGKLLATDTSSGPERLVWEIQLIAMFERNDAAEDIAYCLRNN